MLIHLLLGHIDDFILIFSTIHNVQKNPPFPRQKVLKVKL